jgi:FkbM family methyltransferase
MKNTFLKNNQEDCIQVGHFDIYCNNKKAALEIYKEVFIDKIYQFNAVKKNPVIIDAGSNIGLSLFFFKNLYPLAKVKCFEPDPTTFLILEKNVRENKLKDVLLVNAALARKNGFIPFYGDMVGPHPDSRGNSIIKEWGTQRISSVQVLAKAVKLSTFINEEIDFLKMDIEGAEQEVLEEIKDKLSLINELAIEVHETNQLKIDNSLNKVCCLLEEAGFSLTITEQNVTPFLPKLVKAWAQKVQPKFFIVGAKR